MRRSRAWATSALVIAALAVGCWSIPARAQDGMSASRATAFVEQILEVRVNGQLVDAGAVVLVGPGGAVLVAADDARAWRLRFDESRLTQARGAVLLPLQSVAGLTFELDAARSLLLLTADPSSLTQTEFSLGAATAAPARESGPGAFLNYDLLLQRSTIETSDGVQLRLGAFDGFGVLTSDHSLSSGDGVARRLMTTLRKDFPGRLDTLRIGDFSSMPGSIGRAALIGGLQWGTNFSLQPALVTFPFQSLAGEAALPSTVDVYVNGTLRESVEAPPGPFAIGEIPVITGQGTLQMVVTDSLGRSVTIEQPFFATTQLLRAGLHEASWELGALRRDFGIESNRYGPPVAITTHRWGLNDSITAEIRAEAQSERQMIGVGVATLAGHYGVAQASAAYGGDSGARGSRLRLGIQGQWDRFSFGAEVAAAEAAFRQAGDGTEQAAPPKSIAALTFGWSNAGVGSLGLALVGVRARSGPDSEVVNLSWSREIGERGHLALSYFEDLATADRSGAALTYTQSLGERTSSSLTVSQDAGEPQRMLAEAQRTLDRDPGWGWRARADDHGDGSAELALQRDYGVYRLGTDRYAGDTRTYLDAAGSLVWLSNSLLPTRRIESAFGLVRVPGIPGVRVYFENDVLGVTDADGELLLPGLHPYLENEVRIAVEDLPFDATVAGDRRSGVPFHGTGVLLEFPVRIERGATLVLVQADGRPVPAGARLRVEGGSELPVGDAGYAYVGLTRARSQAVATWPGGACAAELPLPAGNDPQPDLGTIHCRPLAP